MHAARFLLSILFATTIPSPAVLAQDVPDSAAVSPIRLVINIPAFRMDVLRDSAIIRSFDVAVGTPQYPTPLGDYAITEITWNPWWTPPPGEWAREDTVTPPGPTNPMGRVKMQFAPYYLVHGTPLERSIGSAGSHGCVRMRNDDVVALARLLQDSSGIALSDSEVSDLIRSRRTRVVTLSVLVPTALIYRTAEVRSDSLSLYPDVYRLREPRSEALLALAAAGLDTTMVDEERLTMALAASRASAVHTPLDELRSRANFPDTIIGEPRPAPVRAPDEAREHTASSGPCGRVTP
jgi:hypothetical protein